MSFYMPQQVMPPFVAPVTICCETAVYLLPLMQATVGSQLTTEDKFPITMITFEATLLMQVLMILETRWCSQNLFALIALKFYVLMLN